MDLVSRSVFLVAVVYIRSRNMAGMHMAACRLA